jgi:hypothetical protein
VLPAAARRSHLHCCHASFPRQGTRGCSPFGAKTNWLLNPQSLLWAHLGVFVANHVVPVRLVVLHLFVKLFIRLVSETPEITFSKIVGQSTCMFELLFYSLLDRVTFIYFYVFAIALRPCCIICTLLHCGDWFSFVSGYVADMPFRVHRSNND